MLAPAPLDRFGIEPALRADAVRIKQRLRPIAKRALDPFANGDPKPGFGALEQRARRLAIKHFAKNLFSNTAIDLHAYRYPGGQLRDAVVEKRAVHFKADSHGCSVDFA